MADNINRISYTAVVTILAALIMTAGAATAANTTSIYDSDTKLNNGSLSELAIEGTGDAAVVAFDSDSHHTTSTAHMKLDSDSGTTTIDSDPTPSNYTTSDAVNDNDMGVSGVSDTSFLYSGDASDFGVTQFGIGSNENFSLSVWIRGESGGSSLSGNAISITDERVLLSYGTSLCGNGFQFRLSDGSDVDCLNSTAIDPSTQWVHVVGQYYTHNNTMQLYLNGSLVDSRSASDPGFASTNSGIGGDTSNNERYLNGKVDEVHIYDEALSPEQITRLYSHPSDTLDDYGRYVGDTHSFDAVQGKLNFNAIQNATAVAKAQYKNSNGNWITDNKQSFTSPGNHTVTLSTSDTEWRWNIIYNASGYSGTPNIELDWEGYTKENAAPNVDNASAEPDNKELVSSPIKLQINVTDPNSDSVDVRFYVNESGGFTHVGTDTVTNGTAKVTYSDPTGGTHKWHVEADDGIDTQNSSSFYFDVPSKLYIRNESNASELINGNINVSLKFYSEDGTKIVRKTTTDGTVQMASLPVNQRIVVTASADGYFARRTIIESLFEQKNMFLLPQNATAVSNTFEIQDLTGNYPSADSTLRIQRALNITGGNQLSWYTVSGGFFGATNEFPATLKYRARYRIVVENADGDRRIVGTYIPTSSGTQTINIGKITVQLENTQGYTSDVDWVKIDNNSARIEFKYSDPTHNTTDFNLTIHEWGNYSHQIFNYSTNDNLGNLTLKKRIDGEKNVSTRWVVNWSAARSGEQIGGIKQVREQDIPSWLRDLPVPNNFALLAVYVALTFLAMAFSGTHSEIGALTVAGFALAFAWVGWLDIGLGLLVLITLLAAGGKLAEGRRQRV